MADPPEYQEVERQLLCESFKSFDQFNEATRGWDLDFRQLDAGTSPCTALQVVDPRVIVSRFHFSRAYEQRGSTPPNMRSFGIPRTRNSVRWCGVEVEPESILMFPSSRDFEAISTSDFHGYTIAFDETLLSETSELLGLPDLPELLDRFADAAVVEPHEYQNLLDPIERLCDELTARPDQVHSGALREELEWALPAQLLRALTSARATPPRPAARLRDLAVKRATDYIEANAHKPPRIHEVCRAAGASWRTLDYAFREHYGVTPKAYLHALRLHGVRHSLGEEEPSVSVGDVARRWGFWHMGQFAADYRRHFGELPSQTIRRHSI